MQWIVNGMEVDLRVFRTAAAVFDSTAPATDPGMPTRKSLLHDVFYW